MESLTPEEWFDEIEWSDVGTIDEYVHAEVKDAYSQEVELDVAEVRIYLLDQLTAHIEELRAYVDELVRLRRLELKA